MARNETTPDDPEDGFEVLDLRRLEDGTVEATVRYESGLTAVRAVKSLTVSASIHRGPESREMGLRSENLGVVAATYSNPASEIRSRRSGIGTVEVP